MSRMSGVNWPLSPFSSSGVMYGFPGWSWTRKIARALTSTTTRSLAAKGCFAGVEEGFSSPLCSTGPDSYRRWEDWGEKESFLLLSYLDLKARLEADLEPVFEGDEDSSLLV